MSTGTMTCKGHWVSLPGLVTPTSTLGAAMAPLAMPWLLVLKPTWPLWATALQRRAALLVNAPK